MQFCASGILLALGALPVLAGSTYSFSSWNAANGLPAYTQDGVTLIANIGTLAIGSSGVGINVSPVDYATKEINQIEVLTVTFDNPTEIHQMAFSKLVAHEGIFPIFYDEKGQYRVNGAGAWTTFTATSTGGHLTLSVYLPGVTKLEFRPANPGLLNVFNDFALESLSTPEPSTGLPAAAGFAIGLAGYRRRRGQAVRL